MSGLKTGSRRSSRAPFLALLLLCACDDEVTVSPGSGGGERDGARVVAPFDGHVSDARAADAEPADAASAPELDAASPDAAPPDAVPPDALPPDAAPPCDPVPEICNGVDDDCDGEVDEGFDVGAPCGQGVGGCRRVARIECADDGDARCPTTPGEPEPELCDGVDNDCDGLVDEDFDGDGDGAPRCDEDPCAQPCPDEALDRCRALCDAQDCRDENIGVFPGAADVCGDGIDQNCDGADAPCTVATGRVTELEIAPVGAEACLDRNGDGAPDNAMALLGAVANGALADALTGETLNLFLAAAGLAPPGADGAFELSVLAARPAEGGGFELDPATLDEAGDPVIRFPGARVRDGDLRAGPGRFALSLPLAGVELALVLYQAEVRGALAVDESDGLTLDGGLLWGAVSDEDLQATLDELEAGCDGADPTPDYCGPLAMFRPLIANLLVMDEDLDADGARDAYSVCLRVDAAAAELGGWPVE